MRKTKDSRIAELRAALKWALRYGAEARLSPRGAAGIIFACSDCGCGCGHERLDPPPELDTILREVASELRREMQ